MNNAMFFHVVGVALLMVISNLGTLLSLIVSAIIIYIAWEQFQKPSSNVKKVFWIVIAFWGAVGI
ncbi:lmo0954 family membrane protein [Bacillus sp. FJAT-42315]|uniref:lmo0954 family membrane protein n=1 Tax=Bacillus sp. FJAT-42315 TaxID=2014077 RepID=UPI000C23F86A|nr:hypothetical protein [Bacillus sp. FJAT-42315]